MSSAPPTATLPPPAFRWGLHVVYCYYSELERLAVLRINRGFMEYMKEERGANTAHGT